MSAKYTSNITGSNVGAVAVGEIANATGTNAIGGGALTQEQHKAGIGAAQAALIHDQDKLDQIDARLYEALGQFLRMAREIQVEQKTLAETQAKMKDTLDDVWAQYSAKGMRPQALPRTLEVAEALLKHPAMAEVLKSLVTQ